MKDRLKILHQVFTRNYPGLFGPVVLYIVLILYAVFYVSTLYHRFIQIDENWFGEQSYWLVKEGVVKLKSMPGILEFDSHMYLYHKLLVWIGALVIKLFGWSVYPLKCVTLIFYLAYFYVFLLFCKNNRQLYTIQKCLLAVVLLVLIPIMLQQSFTFRPEIFVMTLGFTSYFFLDKFLQEEKRKWLILGSLFSGITFLVTLNAMIFPIAGFFLLLFKKKYKSLLTYSLICGVVCLLFTVDLWQGDHFRVFMYQMKNWPTRKFGETYLSSGMGGLLAGRLMNLLNEHQRFFWSDRVMAFSALFLITYICNFNFLRKKYSSLFIYTTVLILALNITGSHIAERYLVFYYPFLALISAIGILSFEKKNIQYLQYIYFVLIMINLGTLVKQFRFVYNENENAPVIHQQLLARLPDKQAIVFAPWKFIYNEINDRKIVSYQALQYYQDDLPEKMDQITFTVLLKEKYHVKYIILDNDIMRDEENDYDWYRGGVKISNHYLKPLFEMQGYIVYKLI